MKLVNSEKKRPKGADHWIMNHGINHWMINQLKIIELFIDHFNHFVISVEKRCEFPMVDELVGDDMVRYQCLLIGEMVE